MSNNRILAIGLEALQACANEPDVDCVGYLEAFALPDWMPSKIDGPLIGEDVPVFKDVEAAVAATRPDFALIAVPNYAKNDVEMESALMRAGVSILCTKLRLPDWRCAGQLEQLRARSGVDYRVGEHYHLNPVVHYARQHLATIGRPELLRYRFSSRLNPSGSPWMRAYREVLLEDLCYHHFSVLHFLLGFELEQCQLRSGSYSGGGGHQDRLDLLGETTGGYCLNYSGWWGSHARPDAWLGSIDIEGKQGCLQISGDQLYLNGVTVPVSGETAPSFIRAVLTGEDAPERMLSRLEDFLPVTRSIQKGLDTLGI